MKFSVECKTACLRLKAEKANWERPCCLRRLVKAGEGQHVWTSPISPSKYLADTSWEEGQATRMRNHLRCRKCSCGGRSSHLSSHFSAFNCKLLCIIYVCVCTQSCLTLCSSTDCSPPGSSVRGIFQARILERVTLCYSRRSSWPRDPTVCVSCTSCIECRFLPLPPWQDPPHTHTHVTYWSAITRMSATKLEH